MPNLPIGKDDTVVELSAQRHSELPTIYQARNHPLHTGSGISYYIVEKLTHIDMRRIVALEEELKIPWGNRDAAMAQGRSLLVNDL